MRIIRILSAEGYNTARQVCQTQRVKGIHYLTEPAILCLFELPIASD
jgi:hypothetical protein